MLNVGATGNSANANFAAWGIFDNYEGCGVFLKYEIQGNSSTLAELTYPKPGVLLSNCLGYIGSCIQIRVDCSVPALFTFELHLYPDYNQNSISIPFTVDVTPCNTASFTLPSNPTSVVLDRTTDATSLI